MRAAKKNSCKTRGCRGIPTPASHSCYCSKCKTRRWRERHPLSYSFHKLKMRALERGKDFTLTREEYFKFAKDTDYGRLKGKTSLSLSIDRVENAFGYHSWNIRAITVSENARKSFVPFFQQQGLTRAEREEVAELDKKFSRQLHTIANIVAEAHERGSDEFWKEYFARKQDFLDSVESH
jgi:hypothetical protein